MKTILVDAWNTFVTEKGINIELKKILDTYQNQKIIVTNATLEERRKFGIINMPYEVFSLGHDPNKTDALYFEKLLFFYNLKPQEVIYFEHHFEAVQAAKSLKIKTHHFSKLDNLENLITFINSNL